VKLIRAVLDDFYKLVPDKLDQESLGLDQAVVAETTSTTMVLPKRVRRAMTIPALYKTGRADIFGRADVPRICW